MHELAFEEYAMSGGDGGAGTQNFQEYSEYLNEDPPPTNEDEFLADVSEVLAGTGASISAGDLSLITPQEWESFLAALLGFVETSSGAYQGSDYDDYSDEAPLGEYFIESWGWLPSVQHMPGYHYFDYLTSDIDPEFLGWAYAVHSSTSVLHDAGINLADIENMPITLSIGGTLITATWHNGTAPAANLHTNPDDSSGIVITANLGYFIVESQPGPVVGGEPPPTAMDLMQLNNQNAPWIPAVDQALRYLAQDSLALQVLLDAIHHHVKVKIVTGDMHTQYLPNDNVVEWNPTLGLRLTNGGLMSPAMCLLHELAHGALSIFGFDAVYDTLEERYIIEHYEQIIGLHLGEPIRENHQGTFEHAFTVTYHLPAPPQ